HWVKYKDAIGKMVLARKAAGVHSESQVNDEAGSGYYKSTITGKRGSIRLLLGPNSGFNTTPAGYTLAYKGGNFAMYYTTTEKEVPVLSITPTTTYKTETLTVEMSAVALSGTPAIYYTVDGSDPTTSATKKTYTQTFSVQGTVTVKAYAELNGVKSAVQEATYTYQPPQTTPLTVKFMPPATWENVYLYAWDGANLGAWPGMEWKTKDAEGWLYHVFPGDVREVSIIFTNGAGEQSSDILLDQDACYEWNGMEVLSQNCSLSDIPFQLMVAPEGKVFKTESLEITMSTVGEEGTPAIYYTLDNSDPKTSSTKKQYTAPVVITKTTTLKAYAVDGAKETEVQTHTYTYQAPQTTALVVKFFPPESWASVYLYAWDMASTPLLGEWPGTEWTNKDTNGWLYYTFPEAMREVNVIFNNGEGVQTADLYVDEDVCYIWNEDEQKAEIDPECSGSDVENIETEKDAPALDINQPMYNVLGQPVTADYHGVVIQNGYKYIR
ncbi:MAG: starch-binding protein, partial [Paludibacteraceae bacterium]|nr:starch-binding protein [Paludibacteraceae bacterium]